jgi:hypothetical protein
MRYRTTPAPYTMLRNNPSCTMGNTASDLTVRSDQLEAEIDALKMALNIRDADLRKMSETINDYAPRFQEITAQLERVLEDARSRASAVVDAIPMARQEMELLSSQSKDEFEFQKNVIQQQFATAFAELNQKNSMLNNLVLQLREELRRSPVVHIEFINQYKKFIEDQARKNEDFNNDITELKRNAGESVNVLNKLSADFSNHVGDMRSQVQSFAESQSDFNFDQNRRVKAIVNEFYNYKVAKGEHDADFKERILAYGDPRVVKYEASLNEYARPKIVQAFSKAPIEIKDGVMIERRPEVQTQATITTDDMVRSVSQAQIMPMITQEQKDAGFLTWLKNLFGWS